VSTRDIGDNKHELIAHYLITTALSLLVKFCTILTTVSCKRDWKSQLVEIFINACWRPKDM